MSRFLDENRERGPGWEGRRPEYFWQEIREPRRQIGTEEFWGPWTAGGPPKEPEILPVYESDYQFLNRLGMLLPWEIEYHQKAKKGQKGEKSQ